MKRIDAPNATADHQFRNGDPQTGQKATELVAGWHNDVQEEIAGVIEGFGESLDGSVANQMFRVIQAALLAARKADNPVGTVRTFDGDDRNPSEILGFGTWEPYGAGRVIIAAGEADSGTTYNGGDTGGEERHRLGWSELPKFRPQFNGNPGVSGGDGPQQNYIKYSVGDDAQRFYFNEPTFEEIGEEHPHENRQPYIVAYVWKRTA